MSERPPLSLRGSGPFSAIERTIAWRYLRAKKAEGGVSLITTISFLGIMLAVAVMIIVMSVMNGYRDKIFEIMLGTQGHIFVQTTDFEPEDIEPLRQRLSRVEHVQSARAMVVGQAAALSNRGGDASLAVVFGIKPSVLRKFPLITDKLVSGSMEAFGVGRNGGNTIVIGAKMAQKFGIEAGDDLKLLSFSSSNATPFGSMPRGKLYRVGAIFEMGLAEYDSTFIYMPLAQAEVFFSRNKRPDYIEIRVDDPFNTLPVRLALAEAAGVPIYIDDWKDRNQTYVTALKVERTLMRMILLLIVAIAVMNIISGLVMLVKNKSRDIAILRTMGASRGTAMRVFIMAGAAVGGFGTLAGLILGILFAVYIDPIQDVIQWVFALFNPGERLFDAEVYELARLPAKVEWREVMVIAGFGFAMSILVTLPPSWRASRLDPVEALRYE
ncbi:MAG: lipoprotein-releasing ABC transporter permease subunit [Amylibacter sp.]|nr:lipoprotein-releasing ABC transporter permease subunit [Amylibacter sp.]